MSDRVLRGMALKLTVDSAADAQLMEVITGRMVRLGTYGDPEAVGVEYWNQFNTVAKGTTGYTHQWSNGRADDHMHLVMASADNEQARTAAKAQGYRTFRVRLTSEPVLKGEFICPASSEAGKVKTCADCGACAGGINTKKADPVIVVHGSLKSRFDASQMVVA